MNSANICIFEGRITRDPQFSTLNLNGPHGQRQVEKALFTIAVDRALSSDQRQRAKNGDKSVKTADFVPCSLLGAQVATLRQYFFKGKGIRVVGHYEEYQTKNQQTGETKYGHTFNVDSIGFCVQDPKNSQNNQGSNGGQVYGQQSMYSQGGSYQQSAPASNNTAPSGFDMFDESASPF